MKLLNFTSWVAEGKETRPVRKLSDLDINRRFKGDRYESELFPLFIKSKSKIAELPTSLKLGEWFDWMQREDNAFYSMVQADELGQPDVRELWRDLTGRRAAKMRKYNR